MRTDDSFTSLMTGLLTWASSSSQIRAGLVLGGQPDLARTGR